MTVTHYPKHHSPQKKNTKKQRSIEINTTIRHTCTHTKTRPYIASKLETKANTHKKQKTDHTFCLRVKKKKIGGNCTVECMGHAACVFINIYAEFTDSLIVTAGATHGLWVSYLYCPLKNDSHCEIQCMTYDACLYGKLTNNFFFCMRDFTFFCLGYLGVF